MDPLYWRKRGLTPAEQTDGLALFAPPPAAPPPPDPAPDIRAPAPSAPGSESSARAADAADRFRKGQNYRIMLTLATLGEARVMSREELSDHTGIKEASLCARLNRDLCPDYVECVERACISKAAVRVNGYRLTARGRRRLAEREGHHGGLAPGDDPLRLADLPPRERRRPA